MPTELQLVAVPTAVFYPDLGAEFRKKVASSQRRGLRRKPPRPPRPVYAAARVARRQ